MTESEFHEFISREPLVREGVRRVISKPARDSFSLPTDVALIALVFPVLSLIIRRIGLPWVGVAVRYSDLWRIRVEGKLDNEYRRLGIDPARAKEISDALRQELDSTTNTDARAAWERLAKLLKAGGGNDS